MKCIFEARGRRLAILGSGLAALLSLVFGSASASAITLLPSPLSPPSLTCDHEVHVEFDEPITHTGQSFDATVTSTLSGCLSLDPEFTGTITGVFENGRAHGTVDECAGPVPLLRSTGTGSWVFNDYDNNVVVQGQFPFTVNITANPSTNPLDWVHLDGKFISGPLTGYTGWHKPAALLPNGLCQTGGITALETQGTAHFHQP